MPAAAPFQDYPAIVATVAGQVAAFLQFRCVTAGETEILQLFTFPAFRRQGIARALLHDLKQTESPVAVYLEVRESNTPARQLYGSAGFIAIGLRRSYYSDPEEDAIVLSIKVC